MDSSASEDLGKLKGRVLLAIVLMFGLLGGFAVWGMQAKISGAVIASGKVVARAQVKEVQHPHGGIVGEILVENGDHVEEGDVLIRLDDTQVKAELGVLNAQIAEFTARSARLTAERDALPSIDFPEEFESNPQLTQIADGERRIFRDRQEALRVQVDQLQTRIEQFNQEVFGLVGQQASQEVEARILQEELDRLNTLREKGLTQQSKISGLERDVVRINGSISEANSNIARVNGQISETKLSIMELEYRARADAQAELRDIEARLSEIREREIAARDQLERTELKAPISGTVNALAVHTVDGVISPGETVMGIVPEGELVVEAQLMTTDVDQVSVGQRVNLRFSAFNQRTTPEFEGEVLVVGAAAVIDPASGLPHYLSTIRILDPQAMLGERELVPGMPVEVFFETGQRTAVSYLVKPFTDQMERAFREE